MPKTVEFRPELSPSTGYGHLTRAAALIDLLGAEIIGRIVVPESELTAAKELLGTSYSIAAASNSAFPKTDLVILDGYSFSSDYRENLRKQVPLIMINDCSFTAEQVDLLINPGDPPNGQVTTPNTCFGPKFAPIRKVFLSQAPTKRQIKVVERLLICFGGKDASNYTGKALTAAAESRCLTDATVIVSNYFTHRQEVARIAQELSSKMKVKILGQLSSEELLIQMCEHDLAILPSSTIAYEACCVGIGLVVGHYTENQRAINRSLTQAKAALSVGNLEDVTIANFSQLIATAANLDNLTMQLEAQRSILGDKPGESLRNAIKDLLR